MKRRERDVDVEVVVVGGGIGGLANAYALAVAGHSVRVLERAALFAEVGAGLQLAPNATRILRQWGLLDEVIDAGVLPRRLVFRDAVDGSELTHLDFGDEFVARYGAPYVVIHRSDLLDILVAACRRTGVELVSDAAVVAIDAGPDHTVVRTAAGDEHRAEATLAADGLRSTLRSHFSDDEPVASGYVAYRGAFRVQDLEVELDEHAMTDVVVYLGVGCHLVQYPLRRGEMFNTVAVFESAAFHRGETDWGGVDELDDAFAGTCSDVRRGIRSLWRDRCWPMYDREPIDRWVDGRLALTGDAAHPMLQYLAQGACQAIEDAHVLSLEAAKSQIAGDTPMWQRVLARYAAQRSDRTAQVQRTARFWGELWHLAGIGRTLRNELLRKRDIDDYEYVDWLYGT
jgi:salicylate hydroxylase